MNDNCAGDAAQKFVQRLLKEGSEVACDETNNSFKEFGKLPDYYDEEKYKRGQQFYQKHIFGMFLGKLLGLLSVLSMPSVLKILKFTSMSSTPATAYKRYLQTIYHMCIWYDDQFVPGSKLWKSIAEVRNRHNSASKRGCAAGFSRISQKDMALTQFGFMGFSMTRAHLLGIHYATKEELEALVHIWRVVGYTLGIEDRFNICRESVEETQAICTMLLEEVIKPQVEARRPDFIQMAEALINGMWTMIPFLQTNTMLSYLYFTILNGDYKRMDAVEQFGKMDYFDRIRFAIMNTSVFLMQLSIMRLTVNFLQRVALWLMPRFPFLAYYYFGYQNSHFSIIKAEDRKSG